MKKIIFIFLVLVFVPVFMKKVSISGLTVLLKRPTETSAEQWKGAGKEFFQDVYQFYVDWVRRTLERFAPETKQLRDAVKFIK